MKDYFLSHLVSYAFYVLHDWTHPLAFVHDYKWTLVLKKYSTIYATKFATMILKISSQSFDTYCHRMSSFASHTTEHISCISGILET
jgi:hypothetical protein